MLQKIMILLVAATISITTLCGCEQLGEWTGEGTEEVKEGAEKFEEGYEQGKD